MSKRILHLTGWLATVVAVCVLSACGPVASSSAVTDAEAALREAEAANAHRFAAFSYWSAVNYLEKAKQVEGHSEFGPATDFAIKSMELALRSVEETKEFHHQEKLRRERLKKSGRRATRPQQDTKDAAPEEDKKEEKAKKRKKGKKGKKTRKKGAGKK